MYTFGEELTYYTCPYFLHLRIWLNKFKIASTLFFGTWWSPFLPHSNAELITVVGKPLQLPKIEKPTREDVTKYHELYMKSLKELFDRNKKKYASNPDGELEFF